LVDVGLDYLTLDRLAMTLSGGEAQRIRLATQIGSRLSGVLYVLDEPSIGLHQRDNMKLIKPPSKRCAISAIPLLWWNTTKKRCGTPIISSISALGLASMAAKSSLRERRGYRKRQNSVTGDYLAGRKYIAVPAKRRKGNGKKIVDQRGEVP
jgi:excinuclease ABC subunit A